MILLFRLIKAIIFLLLFKVVMEKDFDTNDNSIISETTPVLDNAEKFDSEPAFTNVSLRPVEIEPLEDDALIRESKVTACKRQLALSLAGVFLSTLGVGAILSLWAFFRYFYKFRHTKSLAVKWSLILSVVGIILGVGIFVTFSLYASSHEPPPRMI